jgi:hypothetical protein
MSVPLASIAILKKYAASGLVTAEAQLWPVPKSVDTSVHPFIQRLPKIKRD